MLGSDYKFLGCMECVDNKWALVLDPTKRVDKKYI